MAALEKVREAARAIAVILDNEDEKGETLLGKLEDSLNKVLSHDTVMSVLPTILYDSKGQMVRSAELACYHAMDDAGDILVAASQSLATFSSLLYAARGVLLSTLIIWDED